MSTGAVVLLAVGEAMVDVVVSTPPTARASTHAPIRLDAGGTPVNAARAAAALGASSAVAARIGDDLGGAAIRHALEARDIRAVLAVDESLPTGAFVDLRGAIVADRGANDALAPADVAGAPGHEALLVSGYTFRAATAATAVDVLSASGARWRAVDAGGVPDGTDLSAANVLLGTLAELRADPGEEPEAVALRLLETFEAVAVKLGAAGAVAAAGGQVIRLPAVLEESEGAIGAGDAFDAGLLVGLARGRDLHAALVLGLDAAAAHIRERTAVSPR